MRNLSLRELALVCSPLLIVAVVGLFLARRKPPPSAGKPRLVFRVEKPTVLEAFKGADAALEVDLVGQGTDNLHIYSSTYSLDLTSNSKTYNSERDSGSAAKFWDGVWKGNLNNSRFTINSRQIPPGKLRFNFSTQTQFRSSATPSSSRPPHLNHSWPINRSLIKPFDFKQMPRAPLVALRSVKVTRASGGNIDGECVFDLIGANMNAQTPADVSFSGGIDLSAGSGSSGIGWGQTPNATPAPSPLQRSWTWNTFAPGPAIAQAKLVGKVSGRLSVDNRWPLAFEIAPFDPQKVKVGQSLSFRSWPASTPISK